MSKVINLDALRRKANPNFVAVKPHKRKFAFDYLPPMTASLKNLAPVRHPSQTTQLLAKVGAALPSSYNWANKADVATKRMGASAANASKVAAILKPLNQLGCGSCWAFSTASTLADRYTLFNGLSTSLNLSPTYLLSCDTDGNEGCNGGFPALAGKFFETSGLPTMECQDYTWCPTTEKPNNEDIPACSEIKNSCYQDQDDGTVSPTTSISNFYKAVGGSTQALPTPDALKAEIWHNGPVTATFAVYSDFIGRERDVTNKQGWVNTSNIYVNLTDPSDNPDTSDTTHGLYAGYSPTVMMGGHAVVITGWGLEPNPQGLPADITSKLKTMFGGLPFWVVRNSWGTQWNGDGFFKFAQSVPELNINMTTRLDRSVNQDGSVVGGGTTFLPVTNQPTPKIFTSPPLGGERRGNLGDASTGGTSGSDSTNFWTQPGGIATIAAISVVAVAIIVVGCVVGLKHKKKRGVA